MQVPTELVVGLGANNHPATLPSVQTASQKGNTDSPLLGASEEAVSKPRQVPQVIRNVLGNIMTLPTRLTNTLAQASQNQNTQSKQSTTQNSSGELSPTAALEMNTENIEMDIEWEMSTTKGMDMETALEAAMEMDMDIDLAAAVQQDWNPEIEMALDMDLNTETVQSSPDSEAPPSTVTQTAPHQSVPTMNSTKQISKSPPPHTNAMPATSERSLFAKAISDKVIDSNPTPAMEANNMDETPSPRMKADTPPSTAPLQEEITDLPHQPTYVSTNAQPAVNPRPLQQVPVLTVNPPPQNIGPQQTGLPIIFQPAPGNFQPPMTTIAQVNHDVLGNSVILPSLMGKALSQIMGEIMSYFRMDKKLRITDVEDQNRAKDDFAHSESDFFLKQRFVQATSGSGGGGSRH